MRLYIFLLLVHSICFSYQLGTNDTLGRIKILDVKELRFETKNSIEFKGVSALAYDENMGLFALSDFGYLYHLRLQVNKKSISSIKLINAYALRNKKNKILKKKKRDAEGMVLIPEGLLISFERKPKVSLFDFEGKKIKNMDIASDLEDINNYQKKNRALESLVYHPDFGLITAPELPLRKASKEYHTLYAKNRQWKFKRRYKITAMEVMPNKNLLVLERNFSFLQGHSISLSRVDISDCENRICPNENLAVFQSRNGWNLDNFEGLTHLQGNQYLMISDDNNSLFQKTLMVLFEIKHDKM